jgi:hypothetical protein
LASILQEAGVPPGVVNVLPSRRSGEVVSAMLHDPRVRKLSFTGSTEVGRILLAEAADQVVNTSMELGGNASFLVYADADLAAAVEGAMVAKMRNAGEACTAANRFYVQASVADDFSRRLADRMSALNLGPGTGETTEVGPLVNEDIVFKVDRLVRAALAEGAQAIVGGSRPEREGFYFEPTVLVNVHPDAAILREEIFGPGAPIVTFKDEAQAVALANATEHGLVGYVYTGDLARGLRVSEAGVRHGRSEPRPRQRSGGALRWFETERDRPRGWPRRHARLPRVEVHRPPVVSRPASRGVVIGWPQPARCRSTGWAPSGVAWPWRRRARRCPHARRHRRVASSPVLVVLDAGQPSQLC